MYEVFLEWRRFVSVIQLIWNWPQSWVDYAIYTFSGHSMYQSNKYLVNSILISLPFNLLLSSYDIEGNAKNSVSIRVQVTFSLSIVYCGVIAGNLHGNDFFWDLCRIKKRQCLSGISWLVFLVIAELLQL